jgi:tetratricopeptide (TPR) repeat protein
MAPIAQVNELIKTGNLAKAEELCDRALKSNPKDAVAHHLKAIVRLSNEDTDSAIQHATKASTLVPTDTSFRLTLAKAFAQNGENEKAISVLRNAVKVDKQNYACWLNLGLLCFDEIRFEDALTSFRTAFTLLPERPEAYSGAALSLFQLRQPEAAIKHAKKALSLNENRAVTLCLLGKYLSASKQPEIARSAFAQSLRLAPSMVDSHAGFASTSAAVGDFNSAIKATDELFRRFPLLSRRSDNEKYRVLVLERNYDGYVAGQAYGRTVFSQFNFPSGLPTDTFSYFHHHLDPHRPVAAAKALGKFDLILNNIVNSERASHTKLKTAILKISEELGLPIINEPIGVSETTRVANYQRFKNAKNFTFPKTIALQIEKGTFESAKETILNETPLPVILRPVATHAGKGAKLIKERDELANVLKEYNCLRIYSIAYYNCTDKTDLTRRYRLASIGGELVPVNMHAAHDWNVHGDERTTENWQDLGLDREELAFLADPSSVIGGPPSEIFAEIREKTPLDVFGFDFGISNEGKIIVFEVNASMAFSTQRLVVNYPYLKQYKQINDKMIESLFDSKIENR